MTSMWTALGRACKPFELWDPHASRLQAIIDIASLDMVGLLLLVPDPVVAPGSLPSDRRCAPAEWPAFATTRSGTREGSREESSPLSLVPIIKGGRRDECSKFNLRRLECLILVAGA